MIEIKIPEVYYGEDPNQPAFRRPQVEMFIDGFKKLCKSTNMKSLKSIENPRIGVIPTSLTFNDGTWVGMKRLFEEIGVDFDKEL